MNNVYQDKKQSGITPVSIEDASIAEGDSKILQEIIDILKHPFQTSCKVRNGLGYVHSGENCRTCDGAGKVLDQAFKQSN